MCCVVPTMEFSQFSPVIYFLKSVCVVLVSVSNVTGCSQVCVLTEHARYQRRVHWVVSSSPPLLNFFSAVILFPKPSVKLLHGTVC